MSLLPLIFQDFWNVDIGRPSRLLDQHFGVGILPDDFLEPLPRRGLLRSENYFRPWRMSNSQDVGSTVSKDKTQFQISLDVQQFEPSDLSVKTIDDNCVVVEGKHEERKDEHGFVSRGFVRRYMLPKGHDVKDVVSTLSSDGVLTITAPKKYLANNSNEIEIPISQTGPVKAVGSGDQKNIEK